MISRLFLLSLLLFSPAPHALADAFDQWIELEQTRINRSVDENKIEAPSIQKQALNFRPESRRWFPLKAVWIPERELHVAVDAGHFPPELRKLFVRRRNGKYEYRLLIHPESEKFYHELLTRYAVDNHTFRATSTASSRTVAVQAHGENGPRFFAKLSLDVELGGVKRTIPVGEVSRSVGTSIYLHDLEKRVGQERFVHIPEPFGISPKGWARGGMILRTIPENIIRNEGQLVPLFSLYAIDKRGKSLLQELAEKARMGPEDFVREKILRPFYEGWVQWNLDGAVTMEAHAQNVLLEIDKKDIPTGRFVHRDLGGFNIDMASPNFRSPGTLPSFSSLALEYHQAHIASAREDSLYTYFDGGFLFNVDKELQRIQPGYSKGRVFRQGRKILAEIFTQVAGIPASTRKLATPEGVRTTLAEAEKALTRRAKAPTECAAGFARLVR